MGVETRYDYITDLNVSYPLSGDDVSQGDQHLRGIKNVLDNQLGSLGEDVLTVTGAELNILGDLSNNLVQSFNGRQGEVVPAADDYSIDELSDVDTTTTAPVSGDFLQYDGTSGNWVPVTNVQGIAQAAMTAQEYNPITVTPSILEIDADLYSTSGLTVNTSTNRIINNTGSTVVVSARCAFSFDGTDNPDRWNISIQRNGSNVGSALEHVQQDNAGSSHVTVERVTTLTDGQYIQAAVARGGASNEKGDVVVGGSLTVEIIPGA